MPDAKPKGKKITGKQAAIAVGVAGLLILGYVLYKRRQAASSAGATTAVPGGDVGAGGTLPFPIGTGGGTVGGGGSGGGGGGGGNPPPTPAGSWFWDINPALCGNGVAGCWLWRVPKNADGSCPYGQPNPYHPGGGFCLSTTAPSGAPPAPSGTSNNGSSNTMNTATANPGGTTVSGLDVNGAQQFISHDFGTGTMGQIGTLMGDQSRFVAPTQLPSGPPRWVAGMPTEVGHIPFPVIGSATGGVQ